MDGRGTQNGGRARVGSAPRAAAVAVTPTADFGRERSSTRRALRR